MSDSPLCYLNPQTKPWFPSLEKALTKPNGLLAFGGSLEPEWLLLAYQQGIFPWFCHDQPILWWSPNPRMVLNLSDFNYRRSLAKKLRQNCLKVTLNHAFKDVMIACARPQIAGVWIHEPMIHYYTKLYQQGFAHSIEVWRDDQLVGGLYGIALAPIFFGESMFALINDASKIAMACLVYYLKQKQFQLIDCQQESIHLTNLGARPISRQNFQQKLPNSRQKMPINCQQFDLIEVDHFLKQSI